MHATRAAGSSRSPRIRPLWLTALAVSTLADPGHAHSAGGGFILLLPTHLYIVGGTVVVAASFALVALAPPGMLAGLTRLRWPVPGVGRRAAIPAGRAGLLRTLPSLLSLLVTLLLVVAGFVGSRDPVTNPLPLFVWSVWWIGATFLHALFGNLWLHLNPWSGLYRLVTAAVGRRQGPVAAPLPYPARAGYWPAAAGFLGFAWFELVHPAPSDPAVLAGVVLAYLLATLVGMVIFGERAWLQYGECFSVFFRMISWLSPIAIRSATDQCDGCRMECRERRNCLNCTECLTGEWPRRVEITLPAFNLLAVERLPPSAVAFVLLALSSVSFDGLSRTFFWLTLIGENPLEYPGRTALMGPSTAGLLAVWGALSVGYRVALALGRQLAPLAPAESLAGGMLVLSIVPIALGYHAAHYLPVFLVDIQNALRAAADPFGLGWDLLGTRDLGVVTSFLTDPAKLYPLWYAQLALITLAHVAAIGIAHALAEGRGARSRDAGRPGPALAQLPLVALMVAYTMFGLWLLSTPAVG